MRDITDGWCRAGMIHGNIEYIKKRKGLEGIATLDKILKEEGISLTQIRNLHSHDHVPLATLAKFFDASLILFDGDLEKIRDMGRESIKVSFLGRTILPYIFSVNYILTRAPEVWKDHYPVGELVVLENEVKRTRIVVKNFQVNKLWCIYTLGYFIGIGELCKLKNIVGTEPKCVHEGNDSCEFELSWET
ncbi:MAG: hypothetical protein N3F63_06890 [Thermoplasmata archaeon]|nr:hypothetical protein [Thermoplasmata archaeon]